MDLTEKQKLFAELYSTGLSAKQSAIQAGYSSKSVGTNTTKLLNNPKIKQYILDLTEPKHSALIAKSDEVLIYLTSVLRGTSRTKVLTGEKDENGEYIRYERTPSEKERLKAAEMLAKRYGLLTEKVELSTGENIINVNLVD